MNRGAKGIALIDDSGDRPHLRHVFDVSDTNNRYDEPFSLWQAKPEDAKRIIEELEDAFGDTQSTELQDAILGVALEAATDNAQDYFDALMALPDHGALADLSAEDARGVFDMQIATAVAYTVLRRIGHDLYLAKIALDLTAKKAKDHIGYTFSLNEKCIDSQRYHNRIW